MQYQELLKQKWKLQKHLSDDYMATSNSIMEEDAAVLRIR